MNVCVCVCARVRTQSCLTVCDAMDYTLPGASIHGIFQAKNTGVGCHFLLQGHVPNPGIEPTSVVSPALAGGFLSLALPDKPHSVMEKLK